MNTRSFNAVVVMRVTADSKAHIIEPYHRHPKFRQYQYVLVEWLPGVVNNFLNAHHVAKSTPSRWS